MTAIQIEDQEFPKKCGHTPNRRVIPLDDMVQKIRVASDSRSSADFLIIARTDSRTGHGLDEALRRGEAYAKAGADIIFIESPESEQEMVSIAKRIDAPLLGRGPELEQLLAAIEDARVGRGAVFFVSGEAGIGKSRLVEEVAQAARERGMPVSFGHAWEAGGAPAYWPFIQALRELLQEPVLARLEKRLPQTRLAPAVALLPDASVSTRVTVLHARTSAPSARASPRYVTSGLASAPIGQPT